MLRVLGFLLLLCGAVVSTGYPKLPKCGCENFDLTVIGNVRAGNPDGAGIPDVPVVVGGKQLATTDDKGFYSIHLANDGRIPIRFEAGPPFTPVTRILNIAEDYKGEVRFDVVLVQGEVKTIDATKRNVLQLPLSIVANIATFDIPANTFLNPKTGQVVEHVVATLTAWSPDSDDTAETVPGDFSTRDDAGNKQALLTLGVFRIDFQDQLGARVIISNGCFVTFRARQYADDFGPPTLWTFNDETGLWEVNAPFTEGVELTFIAQVQPGVNSALFNIGYSLPTCYMKVKAYESGFFTRQVAAVDIGVIQFVEEFKNIAVFYNQAYTGKDGVCMRVVCRKQPKNPILRVHLRARKGKFDRYSGASIFFNEFSDTLNEQMDYFLEDQFLINSRTRGRNEGPVYLTRDRCEAGDLRFSFYLRSVVVDPPIP